MSSSRVSFLYFPVSLTLLPQITTGIDPLFHFCSPSQRHASSTFITNLMNLLDNLSSDVPPTGYGIGSVGMLKDRANGMALCRGDVSATACKSCIVDASSEIRKRCPHDRRAVIWYDNCFLKYSYYSFFGNIDTENVFRMWNPKNMSNPEPFMANAKELLESLAQEASVSPKMYAAGDSDLEYEEADLVYGLVQCSRDISSIDCKKCLDGAINELPSCCGGKQGARVVGGSCNVRFEIYPIAST